ncbi:RCC1 domain-containing protein 1 isoform X2 [Bufo gargarizans]|uniref:RCC1 domain-containing protein 1 isoform X2 n=1 Tax=Bufo gargarizans TaxID=30331 RepID=UPI001CF3A36E|nr:RCC1 domain-containing protein 1 isoform X2 [Bufo gargarizans]
MRWFAFGYGGFGQLGAGEEPALTLPKPVQVIGATIDSKEIVKAVPSWSYTALVTDEGSLQLSGCIRASPHQFVSFPGLDCHDVLPSEKYLLVLMKDRAECWDVSHLDCEGTLPEPMWKMALSDVSSTAFPLVDKGHVLPQPPFFRELTPTLQAKKMALGNEHAVLMTSDGKVLTWGAGRHGQLGHGDVEDVSEPRIVEALHGVTMSEVAAGGWHTASISESGDLYCWGWNESGQLGLPSKALQQERVTSNEGPSGCQVEEDSDYIAIQSFPALIDLPQETEAAKIGCGSRHTAALNRCGELYTWGWGKYGQLGHGDTKTLDQPKRVEFFYQNKFSVKDVTCRHWNTYVMCALEAK